MPATLPATVLPASGGAWQRCMYLNFLLLLLPFLLFLFLLQPYPALTPSIPPGPPILLRGVFLPVPARHVQADAGVRLLWARLPHPGRGLPEPGASLLWPLLPDSLGGQGKRSGPHTRSPEAGPGLSTGSDEHKRCCHGGGGGGRGGGED